MATHEHTVVVERPLITVYDQWTQFETYPNFMDNVDAVEQVDDAMTHWKVSLAGVSREYDAQIMEQRPGEVIAWQSVSGPRQAGRVSFAQLAPERTRVTLRMDFEPHGLTENVGEAVGVVASSVEGSLERFKDYIEDREDAEGGWHGTIADGVKVQGAGAATTQTSYGSTPSSASDSPVGSSGSDVTGMPLGATDDVRDLS
jgi:uncharacterized membrane protein